MSAWINSGVLKLAGCRVFMKEFPFSPLVPTMAARIRLAVQAFSPVISASGTKPAALSLSLLPINSSQVCAGLIPAFSNISLL
ncbi:hypothetical protein D3C87_2102270 [compost metagenome]